MRFIWGLLLGLLIVLASFSFSVVGELRYSKVFLYDIDGDGVFEIVSDIGFVRDNAFIPFSKSLDVHRFKCYLDVWCLMLVDRSDGVARVYAPGRFVGEFLFDGVVSVSNYPYNILTVGSRAYWLGSWFKASLDPVGRVKAFLYDGKLTLAYIDRVTGYVVIEFPGYLQRILPFNGSIAGVGASGDSIQLLLSSPTGSALIEWSPRGVFKVYIYNVTLWEALAYVDGAFIANGEAGVYIVKGDSATLVLEGYRVLKVGFGGEILAVRSDRVLVAEAYSGGLRSVRYVDLKGVVDLDYGYGILAYTDGLKVDTVKYKVEGRVELSIPPSAIAREPVTLAVLGDFNVAYVSIPDVGVVKLTPRNSSYTWRPITPGSHVVIAVVETGSSQTVISKSITVAPRPVILTIKTEDREVKPYSSVSVTLELVDGLTRVSLRDVLGECVVQVSNVTYPARPWIPVVIPAIPVGVEVPIVAWCTLPQPYGEARSTVTLRISEPYVKVELLYLGGGVIRFHAYNIYTGEPVEGDLRVTIGGDSYTINVGGEVRLPRPGLWEVRFELLSGNVVLYRGSAVVAYYESVEKAPPRETVAVADRFITVTDTKVEVEYVTRTELREVARADPITALLSFIAGIALAGVPLVIILIRRAGGGE